LVQQTAPDSILTLLFRSQFGRQLGFTLLLPLGLGRCLALSFDSLALLFGFASLRLSRLPLFLCRCLALLLLGRLTLFGFRLALLFGCLAPLHSDSLSLYPLLFRFRLALLGGLLTLKFLLAALFLLAGRRCLLPL
jgi:hypothetical protein